MCVGKDGDGGKLYSTKHYFLWKLKEIVCLMNEAIKSDHGKGDISEFVVIYGSLWRLLNSLKHIRYQNEIHENTCTCDYCENIELMLKAFWLVLDEETSLDSAEMLVDQICCNPQSLSCVDGSHSPKFKDLCKKVSEIDEVSFYKWVSGEQFPEKKVQLIGSEASEELTKQIKFYLIHNYNK